MKKLLLALSTTLLLAACGNKPTEAEPVAAEPELTAAPMETTEPLNNELNEVGTATATDDVAVAEAH